jgi:hypothetical protein
MTRRILFSLFTGTLFGILLAAAPTVQAQNGPCFGYCQEHILRNGCVSDYAGCILSFDENGNLDGFTCFYVNTCVTKPNNV